MSISIDDFIKICNNVNIIDIRNKIKYNNNHILNARNIDKSDLILNPHKYLNKNTTYYIYCEKGLSSLRICQILSNMGYKTISIKGGYQEWLLRK